jgi:hypothetical protein
VRASSTVWYAGGPNAGCPAAPTFYVQVSDPDDAVTSVTLWYEPYDSSQPNNIGKPVPMTLAIPPGSTLWQGTLDSTGLQNPPAGAPYTLPWWIIAVDKSGLQSKQFGPGLPPTITEQAIC